MPCLLEGPLCGVCFIIQLLCVGGFPIAASQPSWEEVPLVPSAVGG